MVKQYAERTGVSSDKSREEIRKIVQQYGAQKFGTLDEPNRAVIMFEAHDRRIRFILPLPARDEFTRSGRGVRSSAKAIDAAHEQAVRQRWRALALAIKAKLESVASKIETFEEAFYAHVVLPNNATIYEQTHAQVAQQIATGGYAPLMLTAGDSER